LSAGADSFAYGANLAGDTAYLGGWGYLMGADGSSYWIGMEALRAVALAEDRRGITTMLTNRILAAYGLASARDLYGWLYREQGTPQPVLVNIAGMVMTAAEKGDEAARKIIERAASQLGALYRAVGGQINLQSAPVVFHGALLEKDTPLRTSVMAQLGLREIPERDHKPVTGAALLAKLATRSDVLI
jgi:N-acetylglucosamine kinase-like BadF-type ATPase